MSLSRSHDPADQARRSLATYCPCYSCSTHPAPRVPGDVLAGICAALAVAALAGFAIITLSP